MEIMPIDFNYNDTITVISKKQFDVHMKLYKDYVNKINEITKELKANGDRKNSNATYSKYRGLKKSESYALDGTILHELYFQNIGGEKTDISKTIADMLTKHFNGYENWEKDFIACAKSARGWCILAYDQRTCEFRNILQDLHDEGIIMSAYPLIVLDMYEHAYYIDYENKKDEYINKFLSNINWNIVERRLNKLG